MAKKEIKYGCIDEDSFSLRSPRMIDSDVCHNVASAFDAALDLINTGAEKVSICRCTYNAKQDCWFEIPGDGTISVDACGAEWLLDEDE